MKSSEIRNMTNSEIEHTISSLQEKLFKMRAEVVAGRVERPHNIRLLKKDIARCNTILKEKSGEK